MSALFKQRVSFVDKLPVGRPTTTITTSANLIQAGIGDKLSILVQSLTLVVAASALVFIMVVFSITVPIFLGLQKKVDFADEKASSVAAEALGTMRTIVACGAEARLGARYAEWIAEARKRGLRIPPVMGVHISPANFAMYCNFALTFWFGVRQYSRGNVDDIGQVVIPRSYHNVPSSASAYKTKRVIFSVLVVVSAISMIASPMIAISKAISASTAFFEVLDAPSPNTSGLKEPEISASRDIKFHEAVFSYPSRPNVKVLNKLSLCLPAGKITALVGASGCGKSTIVALLERWYQLDDDLEPFKKSCDEEDSDPEDKKANSDAVTPNGGTITLGDTNIVDVHLKWWRSRIGLVQQEPFCFNTSIYQNVSYGLVGSEWEGADETTKRRLVKEACIEAFADEFINKLPEGYDTLVGENGMKLSGGQRQRLAIARSIIKKPSILILDEATSSIDVRGERIVQEALDRVSKNRTTITIAHRLSTIKKADKIILLKGGQAMEEGTHEELLAQGGLYHALVKNQQLEMDDSPSSPLPVIEDVLEQSVSNTRTSEKQTDDSHGLEVSEEVYKPRSLIRSVGLFLWEQGRLWWLYASVIIGAVGCGAAFSVQSFIFAHLVETFQLTEAAALRDRANFWALMFFILAIGVFCFYFLLGFSSASVSTRSLQHIATTYRQEYFESIIRKPIPFFDKEENSAGALTGRLSSDPSQLQELLGPYMAFPLISLFNIFGCIAISFAFGWKLTLVSVFSAFPLIILAMFVRVRYELRFERLNAAVFAESSQFASEAIGAFRTVTSLTLEDSINQRYAALLRSHGCIFEGETWLFGICGLRQLGSGMYGIMFLVLVSSTSLAEAGCFRYGGQLVARGEYDVVQFFVVYIAIILGGQASGQFGSLTPNMAQASAAANRIISLRPSESEASSAPDARVEFEGGARIEFKSVSFKYPTRDVPVFRNLNLTVERGQFAAFVGPSGCGKTSIISILESIRSLSTLNRFYDYQAGSIYINGVELQTLEMKNYRSALSLVSQEPIMYQGAFDGLTETRSSIRDNVLLGVDRSTVTDEELYQTCRDAEIHDFIQSLPDGYATEVGNRGLSLSGGQKQRLSIARALMRRPHVLLLDEATSSLDSESEKQVQAAIERTAKGRTVLVVAHRLATVQNADVIFVFGEARGDGEKGDERKGTEIVEYGDHRSLIRKRGVYFEMCESQALDR
ncbi:LOW QUALITY PROTEIN: lipid A export ATP-binding/permease protein msbA [Coccidioides immitis RMSCC 2394]|uniref:Lipid A export ATP-binding/permease protein msbA n=1 Tax=Coccidioides immitis RMSCC 2394 TaxID=404692 RepID=A0A0J7ARK9_COCIT|nr:LOW QUALITY PROTEIN: lipid A export ATP-binding/permease protein msbA [Coccidioides immitis RMSCC 2394]